MDKEDLIYINMHTHTKNEILAIKKNAIIPFAATWTDLGITILGEVRRKTTIICYHFYMES